VTKKIHTKAELEEKLLVLDKLVQKTVLQVMFTTAKS
jgi:hypothetical protein